VRILRHRLPFLVSANSIAGENRLCPPKREQIHIWIWTGAFVGIFKVSGQGSERDIPGANSAPYTTSDPIVICSSYWKKEEELKYLRLFFSATLLRYFHRYFKLSLWSMHDEFLRFHTK
jgi:hypothetical protein